MGNKLWYIWVTICPRTYQYFNRRLSIIGPLLQLMVWNWSLKVPSMLCLIIVINRPMYLLAHNLSLVQYRMWIMLPYWHLKFKEIILVTFVFKVYFVFEVLLPASSTSDVEYRSGGEKAADRLRQPADSWTVLQFFIVWQLHAGREFLSGIVLCKK